MPLAIDTPTEEGEDDQATRISRLGRLGLAGLLVVASAQFLVAGGALAHRESDVSWSDCQTWDSYMNADASAGLVSSGETYVLGARIEHDQSDPWLRFAAQGGFPTQPEIHVDVYVYATHDDDHCHKECSLKVGYVAEKCNLPEYDALGSYNAFDEDYHAKAHIHLTCLEVAAGVCADGEATWQAVESSLL